jgi:hypothetical protein
MRVLGKIHGSSRVHLNQDKPPGKARPKAELAARGVRRQTIKDTGSNDARVGKLDSGVWCVRDALG